LPSRSASAAARPMKSPLSQLIQRSMPVCARRVALGEFRDQMPKLFSSRSDRSALNPYSVIPELAPASSSASRSVM
jgi:hypothetical protein